MNPPRTQKAESRLVSEQRVQYYLQQGLEKQPQNLLSLTPDLGENCSWREDQGVESRGVGESWLLSKAGVRNLGGRIVQSFQSK